MSADGPWHVQYTNYTLKFLRENVTSEHVMRKLFSYRELLSEFPDLGAHYDPQYQAARPPFPCRRIPVPDTPFSLYYLKEEEKKRIVIFAIEYDRADPNARFSHVDWTLGGFAND